MSTSESRQRRLEELTRSITRRNFFAAGEVLRTVPGAAEKAPDAGPVSLPDACGGETASVRCAMGEMPCWLIRRNVAELDAAAAEAEKEYAAVLSGARQRFDELKASAALCHAANGTPETLLFMDTETCGFAGTPIFLVGVMFHERKRLVFEQWLARDYTEEAAILQAFSDQLASHGVLVTFNGKSFDLPRIVERGAFHGVELDPQRVPHLDLLHECRRMWKHELPDCRLQTLERHFCGRHRTGDIPGSAIPEAYHRFVDDGDARRLADILHHNALDLLTMSQLLCSVLTSCLP